VRNNTPDPLDVRWDVLKSMLDDFPQLRDRVERYIQEKNTSIQTSSTDPAEKDVRRLLQKTLREYRQERSRK
jgi:hypothetical protein